MALGRKPDLYFWRSHDGLEVDLLIMIGGKLQAVEIKLTATPNSGHIEPLTRFQKVAGSEAHDEGVIVCRAGEVRDLPGGHRALPWKLFPSWLQGKLATHEK